MSIIGKPNQGSWQLKTGTFGPNNTPVPDSLFMMEEGSGQIQNSGVDAPLFPSDVLTAIHQGDPASGDSFLRFENANEQVVDWNSLFGITGYPFTFAVVYQNYDGQDSDAGVFGIGDSSAPNIMYYMELNAGSRGRVVRSNTSVVNTILPSGVGELQWRLLAVTFVADDDANIVMDDLQFENQPNVVTFNVANTDFARMGGRPKSPASHWLKGNIAAVIIWKDVALSIAQVQTDLWNGGVPWDYLESAGDNLPPILDTPEPDQFVTTGVPYFNDVSGNFSDPNDDPLTFDGLGLPNGLIISNAGIISGTPTGGFMDIPPPELTSPIDTETGPFTSEGVITTNRPLGLLFAVVTQSATTPTHDQIMAGEDHLGAPADASSTTSPVSEENYSGPTETGENTLIFAGLQENTAYFTHFTQEDNFSDSDPTPVSASGFTTESSVVAPVLSSPIDAADGHGASTASVTSDIADGTVIFAVVTQSATTPTHEQIVAGQDDLGAPADADDAVFAIVGVNNLAFSGLDEGTAYFTHFAQNGAINAVPVSSSGFTTDALDCQEYEITTGLISNAFVGYSRVLDPSGSLTPDIPLYGDNRIDVIASGVVITVFTIIFDGTVPNTDETFFRVSNTGRFNSDGPSETRTLVYLREDAVFSNGNTFEWQIDLTLDRMNNGSSYDVEFCR